MKHILTVLSSLALVLPAIAADPVVPYPAGYRNWHHVKSMVIDKGHPLHESFGGIHHLYANPKAMVGYKSGKFPDGAIIVFDLLEAKSADNTMTEGTRKVVGVMHKNAKKYATTGGWGFEGFGGGDRKNRVVRDNAASACFACHAPQKDNDYVFSRLRD
ncbi:MAG: cytochrome C [Comamonadaceae bacterium CG_4_9_14_0_8_um_filter_57_21]|nr:MAG: cytochrome C [Comamonadaceae bacterium CG_4_10_14_0_8_um_filter_57_29]PJC22579.1 MAG: cytochrome C [Comamonadaceae bacterium CG_4_9_14_0_8_um_filter_57_21]